MTSVQDELGKQAVLLESTELKDIRMDRKLIVSLEAWLLEMHKSLLPKPSDYEHRRVLIAAFNNIATACFGKKNGFPVVEPFGSFVMDVFTAGSDLDLSINFSSDSTTEYPRSKKVSQLKRFTKHLYKLQRRGHISKLSPILQARVPVIKVVDSATGIECDVSAENKDGVSRSSILTLFFTIDERFRLLSYLMKAWAKAHDINSSKDRTMNSLTIISLVAFHLQTQDPPILPPFSALLKDGADVSSIQNVVDGYKNFGRRNIDPTAKLFITMLIRLSAVESLWQEGLCASTYKGTWIKKEWGSGISGNMSVEDFLDRSQNFARCVGKLQMNEIYDCINGSIECLSCFMKGQTQIAELNEKLFKSVAKDATSSAIEEHTVHKRSTHIVNSSKHNTDSSKKARNDTVRFVPNDLASSSSIRARNDTVRFAPSDLASSSSIRARNDTVRFAPSDLATPSLFRPRIETPAHPNSPSLFRPRIETPILPNSTRNDTVRFAHNVWSPPFRPPIESPILPNSTRNDTVRFAPNVLSTPFFRPRTETPILPNSSFIPQHSYRPDRMSSYRSEVPYPPQRDFELTQRNALLEDFRPQGPPQHELGYAREREIQLSRNYSDRSPVFSGDNVVSRYHPQRLYLPPQLPPQFSYYPDRR